MPTGINRPLIPFRIKYVVRYPVTRQGEGGQVYRSQDVRTFTETFEAINRHNALFQFGLHWSGGRVPEILGITMELPKELPGKVPGKVPAGPAGGD